MRANWSRATPLVDLGLEQISQLIQPAFPDQTVIAYEPTEGGLANTNIYVRLAPSNQQILLRLYVRNANEGRKELPLHQHLAGRVPVPTFFYRSEDNPISGHSYVIMEWITGSRVETIAPHLPPDQLRQLGHAVGGALAAIHAVTFREAGSLALDLSIAQPLSIGKDGLVAFLHACLIEGRGATRLGSALTAELFAFVEASGGLLDDWDGPPCLVHGDFGGSNILVRPERNGWEVAAVLDWEFAYSGSPFVDFGNLLRPPLGELAGFEQAVHDGYLAAGGRLPPHWRWLSRMTDLLSWADFLHRSTPNASMIQDAQTTILRTIQAPLS